MPILLLLALVPGLTGRERLQNMTKKDPSEAAADGAVSALVEIISVQRLRLRSIAWGK